MSQNRKNLRRRVERAESLTPKTPVRWTLYWITQYGIERAGFPDEPPRPLEPQEESEDDSSARKGRAARSKSAKTSPQKRAAKKRSEKTLKKAKRLR